MKQMLSACLVAGALLLGTAAAQEKDNRTPLEVYRGDSMFHLIGCDIKNQIAGSNLQVGKTAYETALREASQCEQEARRAVLLAYDRAAKTLKAPAARDALKTYHAAWASTMSGAATAPRRTHEAAKLRLEELWTRVELEAR